MKIGRFFTRMVAACLLGTLLVAPMPGWAMPILTPAGLNPGDQYQLAFRTTAKTFGDLSDAAFYHQFVQNRANIENIGIGGLLGDVTWRAVVSTVDNLDVETNAPVTQSVYNLAGQLVGSSSRFASEGGFYSSSHQNPILFNEGGIAVPGSVWTGFTCSNGCTPFGVSPLGTNFNGAPVSTSGRAESTSVQWANFVTASSLVDRAVYGLSEVLTVPGVAPPPPPPPPAVPEPSSLMMLVAGLIALAGRRRPPAA